MFSPISLIGVQIALAITENPNPHELSWDVMAVNPITNKIYASSTASPDIIIIDGKTNVLIHTIPIPNYPTKIVLDPNTNKVYALPAWTRQVIVINGSTDIITKTINWTSSGEPPHSIDINTNTNMIYVAAGAKGLMVINGSSDTIKKVIPDLGSGYLLINPTTNLVYYSDSSSQIYKIINGSTNNVIENSYFIPFEFNAVIDTKTNRIYDQLGRVIDMNTNKISFPNIIHDKNVTGVGSVAINQNSDMIYIKPLDSSTISIINGTSNSIIGTIPIDVVYSMAVNPNTNKLYVNSDDKIQVIDTETNKIIDTIDIGSKTVPEFPFAIVSLVLSMASLLVFYRIKFRNRLKK